MRTLEERLLRIYRQAFFIRNFEELVIREQAEGRVDIPVYLSLGQEFVAAAVAEASRSDKPAIFCQHRAHAYFLSFGGSPKRLLNELRGSLRGSVAAGMGGSIGLFDPEIPMFGHTGMMGEQVYLGVGWAHATRRSSIIVLGDATIEEDYVGPCIGFAAQNKLPITFVCEDNGLAVLTPTEKRRSWNIEDLVRAYGLPVTRINDDPEKILEYWTDQEQPRFLIANVRREARHVGAQREGTVEESQVEVTRSSLLSMFGDEKVNSVEQQVLDEVSHL